MESGSNLAFRSPRRTANGVRLTNGAELKADVVLVGIGVDPTNAIARDLGLSADAGIEVDALGRTAVPNVFSAGDVALQWSKCHDRVMRVETWANAQNQAISVAGNMLGADREYDDPCWFWSDQYDLNIQVVGDMLNADHIVRGDMPERSFLRGRDCAVTKSSARSRSTLPRTWPCSVGWSHGRPRLDRSDIELPAFDLRRALKSN